MLKRRHLGTKGPSVSAIGLGCMGMSQSYGPGDDAESIRTIHRALDLGLNFLDTAAIYAQGVNETLVGKAIAHRRPEVFLASKCGIVGGTPGFPGGLDGSPKEIKTSCDASLRRLNIDRIDLFYLHRVDPKTPIEESVGAMADLVRAGKIRYIGLSEASPSTIRRAHAVHKITALQSEYSLWWREPETTVIPVCRELEIGFVPFSPLGRGFLTGRLPDIASLADDDLRRHLPRFQEENLAHNRALVDKLSMFAAGKGVSPTQLALAWILAKGDDIVPIPGTKRRVYLESNAAAADIHLTASEVKQLDSAFPFYSAAGERYNEKMAAWVDRS